MQNKNPKAAVDAILDEGREIEGIEIKPITLARYALLELVESPLIDPAKKFTVNALLPTLFVCSADKSELKGFNSTNIGKLYDKVQEWADGLDDFKMIAPAVVDVQRRLADLLRVSPDSASEPGKEKNE